MPIIEMETADRFRKPPELTEPRRLTFLQENRRTMKGADTMTAAQCITKLEAALATMSIAEQEKLASDLEQLAAHYQKIASKVQSDLDRAHSIAAAI